MEKELFSPIKNFFEEQGFIGDGEVRSIDLYMEKEGQGVAVELKETLDFKAVRQAALRQKTVETVFIGIFRPKDLYSASFRDRLYLLQRLGIGLILVSRRTNNVEIFIEPVVKELSLYQQRNRSEKKRLATELQKRKSKMNTGGINKTKIITGYREDALLVLHALHLLGGSADTKSIRAKSGVQKSTTILHDNYYGWFANEARGKYSLRKEGEAALTEYREVLKKLNNHEA